LATVRGASPQAPLGENEGVVHIESDQEEEFVGGPAFKRRKTNRVATSNSSSAKRPTDAQDDPPRASSPPPTLALEEAVGTSAEPAPETAPEHPSVVQHFLRGWRQAKAGNSTTEDALIESVFCSLGGLTAQAHDYREQTTKKKQAMADEVAKLEEELVQR